jgi:hypothetical protein
MPSDEVVVVDSDALEYGVTEMLPVVRRPRWTPEFASIPSMVVDPPQRVTIAPRGQRDQVAGEIDLAPKRR